MSKFAFETRTCLSECLILFTLSCAMSEYLYRGVQRRPNSEMTCIRRYDKHVRVSNALIFARFFDIVDSYFGLVRIAQLHHQR